MKFINNKYSKWLKSEYVSNKDKKQIKLMNQQEIIKSFSKELLFGTAGIRVHMGLGSSLLNKYTIKMIAYAWIKCLQKENSLQKGLVIGHDSRNNGKKFALILAQVISGMGYKAFLYANNDVYPTPIVSFTIKDLDLDGGATITASHNPPEYNGCKIFGSYGQHIMPQDSEKITNELKKIDINTFIPMSNKNIVYLRQEYSNYYLCKIKEDLKLKPIKTNMKIVFSPQHGATYKLGPKILEDLGFNVFVVKSQSFPDGNFSNTPDPNPENPLAFEKMIKLGTKINAQLLLTTDPDGDRVAIGVLHNKKYKLLNGHEISVILTNYMLSNTVLKPNDFIIKTVVTTSLDNLIANHYKVNVLETLTGFKFLGNAIILNKNNPIIATEESYGSLICPNISLDKDALQILPIIATIAFKQHQKKLTIIDYLNDIYNKYGYFIQYNQKLIINKNNNMSKINKWINDLSISQEKFIKKIEDYRKSVNGLPQTNLIKIYFDNYTWVAIRPSGTEPLIRKYFCIRGKNLLDAQIKNKKINDFLEKKEKIFHENKN